MKTWKIVVGVVALAAVGGSIFASMKWNQKGIVIVQTGKTVRQDLTSVVTASGEVKPRNYINIGSNAQGASRIMEILVVEGARVKKGQLLAKLESVQPEAEVAAQRATVSSSEADSGAAEAALKAQDSNIHTLQANLDRVKTDLVRAKADFDRSKLLLDQGLVSKQDFDMRRASYESFTAAIPEAEARSIQARAQREHISAQLV